MNIERYGLILNVEHFDECVRFYKKLFNLPTLQSKSDGDFRLTCLALGDAYLMIETGGTASEREKKISENPTKLRFNVADIDEALERVLSVGIDAHIEELPWGKTINIVDPDGNRVGIRDEASF